MGFERLADGRFYVTRKSLNSPELRDLTPAESEEDPTGLQKLLLDISLEYDENLKLCQQLGLATELFAAKVCCSLHVCVCVYSPTSFPRENLRTHTLVSLHQLCIDPNPYLPTCKLIYLPTYP